MAYDHYLAERIKHVLESRKVNFYEKKMFGGSVFMVDDKMCVGVVKDHLMARINPDDEASALKRNGARLMDFTGKPMKGYVFVSEKGYQSSKDASHYIQLCLNFNPLAKKSKSKK